MCALGSGVGPVSEALLKSSAWKSAAGAYGFKNYVGTPG